MQVTRKKDRITAKNETGWLAIIVVDGKQKLAVPTRKEAKQSDTGGSPRRSLIDNAREDGCS